MSEISRSALFGKLNPLAYKAIESATVFCKLRGNPYVELVHVLKQVLELPDSDLHKIMTRFEIDRSRVAQDMTNLLDELPRGATSISDFSPAITEGIEAAWLWASLKFGESAVRTGHLIVGLMKTPKLKNWLLNVSTQFAAVKPDDLAEDLYKIVKGSPEDALSAQDGSELAAGAQPGEASGAMGPAQMGRQEALKKFATDLTKQAASGKMDPIVGRDNEIRQVIDILMRRRQNNPILTGEAGVGKTAVVEGFAQRIAAGDVPPSLKNVKLLSLDIGLLQAGASMKGEFENRLKQVIEEVQSSETPIILFIDEAHTLIGAGGAAGSGDAANLLKPALARGTLRTIAATTWAEYKKYIEKDPALTRRFQVVQVDEPEEPKAVQMMRGLAEKLEAHHKVPVLDEALDAAVRLSARYISGRQLPDKCVSLLDTACARVAVSQHGTPAELEDTMRRLEANKLEASIAEREAGEGVDNQDRRKELAEIIARDEERRSELEKRVGAEKALVESILSLRDRIRKNTAARTASDGKGGKPPAKAEAAAPAEKPEDPEQLRLDLKKFQADLAALQGEKPMIMPAVDAQAVASVVADWTGIPVGRMVKNEMENVLKLGSILGQRVIGQDAALETIAKRIRTSRAGLDDPKKPIGVFLLVGPSGVGKTETALALGEAMYGGEHNVITINMSEFQEAHTVSTLKGAPPGYVGYGEGGVLTEAVRRKPYSVVLLDEVEKAHPDVHEIFFQVFDKGFMEDGEGRFIDFKNTVILLTSNAGTDLIMSMCKDPDLMPDPDGIVKGLREPLLKVFPAALLGRLVVVPYYPIGDDMLRSIIRLKIGRIASRLKETRRLPFTWDEELVELVKSRCTEVESGARAVDAILTNTMLPEISREYLNRMLDGSAISRIHVGVKDGRFDYEIV